MSPDIKLPVQDVLMLETFVVSVANACTDVDDEVEGRMKNL